VVIGEACCHNSPRLTERHPKAPSTLATIVAENCEATVAVSVTGNGESPNSATIVAVFGDYSREIGDYSRQCGQDLSNL